MKLIMKNKLKILACALAAIVITGCGTSSSGELPEKLQKFMDQTEKELDSCTDEQWQEAEKKFDQLIDKYSQNLDKMTEEQRKEIERAISQFDGMKLRRSLKDAADKAQKALENAPEKIDGFIDGLIPDEKSDEKPENDTDAGIPDSPEGIRI